MIALKKNVFEFNSIRTKMMVIIVMMLIVSGTVLTGVAAFLATKDLEHSAINTLQAVGQSSKNELILTISASQDVARIFSSLGTVNAILTDWPTGSVTPERQNEVSEYAKSLISETSDFMKGVNILDTNGICIISDDPSTIGKDYSKFLPSVNQQKTGNPSVNQPFLGTGNEPLFGVIAPVVNANGKEIGFVLVGLRMAVVSEITFTTPGLSEYATNFLVDSEGTIISGVSGDYTPFLTKKFDLSIFPAGETMVEGIGYFGLPAYIVKNPVSGTDWFIITTERVEEVSNPIMHLVTILIVSLLIVIVIGAFVAVFIANGFSRPIQDLKDAATHMALGDVDVTITHVGTDEIGQLADAFRHMLKNTTERVDSVIKIASGDVNFKIIIASEKDREGHALVQMKKTLAAMTESLSMFAHQSAEGNLSYRSDATQFKGVYYDLIETLNQAFDQIIDPIQEVIRLSTSYSSGDYSDRFNPDLIVKGEFVPFKAALNQIGINSSNALLKIRLGVHDISVGASESSVGVQEIASAVSTLAESSSHVSLLADRNDAGLEQALTAMNDLASTVSEVAGRTAAISELVTQTSNLTLDGVKRAESAGKGMEEISIAAAGTAKSVSDISSQMDEIGGIVDVITGIAEQTSLLALNAAIEAARAGDAGLGFAVVADEVKALAQESQTSAEHIGIIITNLQKLTSEMAVGMKKASEVVQSGSNAVDETITIFNQMAEAISDVNRNMSEVASASEEQAASVEEITASMTEVRDMVQDTVKEATDSAAAAEEISASLDQLKGTTAQSAQLAETIAEQVGQFKIE